LREIDSFRILMLLNGEAELGYSDGSTPLSEGQTTLLPAALGDVTLRLKHHAVLLDVTLPH